MMFPSLGAALRATDVGTVVTLIDFFNFARCSVASLSLAWVRDITTLTVGLHEFFMIGTMAEC